jgi:hypothetical protein
MSESSQGNLGSPATLSWNGAAIAEIKGEIPHVEFSASVVGKTNRDSGWEESSAGN